MGNLFKNIIIGVIFTAAVFVFIYRFDGGFLKDAASLTSLSLGIETPLYAQETVPEFDNEQFLRITGLLNALRTVKLDTAFFNDPLYKSLIDSGVSVPFPSEKGRVNPFAPF